MFGKNIIGLENFSADEIRLVLKTAAEMKKMAGEIKAKM